MLVRKISSLRILIVGALAASVSLTAIAGSSAAPEYPPSIQPPVVNEPIITPVPPRTDVDVVVVPKATSETIPSVSEREPVRVTSSAVRQVPQSTLTPVQVTSSLILGGVRKSEVEDTPIARVSSRKSAEIQVASDVPTRIQVTRLPANSTARIQVVGANGRVISLGQIRIDSNGNLILPPLTKTDSGKSTTLRIVVGGRTIEYNIRSTN